MDKNWEEKKAKREISENAKQTASFRAEVAHELFNALPVEEHKAYVEHVTAEAQAERERYKRMMKEGPLTKPEDRNVYVTGFINSSILLKTVQGL